MKSKFGKLLVLFIFILVLAVVGYFTVFKSYEYSDEFVPPSTYKITINTITKELKGEFYHSCDYVGCESSTNKYSINLTEEEYKNIMKLWNDKEHLSPILELICENDKVFYKSYEDSYELYKEIYNEIDVNSDGMISRREFANKMLTDLIKNI